MNIFKKRTVTKNVIVCCKACSNFKIFKRMKMKAGMLDSGFHYYIDRYGNITADRNNEAVARKNNMQYDDDSVFVLVDADSVENISRYTQASIEDVVERVKRKFGNVEMEVIYNDNEF